MFRLLLLILCVSVASAAPQDSAVSYIKPLFVDDNPPEPVEERSEPSLEEIPTTIRDDILLTNSKISDINVPSDISEIQLEESDRNQHSSDEYSSTTVRIESSEITETIDRNNSTEAVADHTEAYVVKARKPSPRFISKLSYFKKSDYEQSPLTNFIERPGKKKFRSKCRCERIWNCPKLQITVPRCPNEYFMCCF